MVSIIDHGYPWWNLASGLVRAGSQAISHCPPPSPRLPQHGHAHWTPITPLGIDMSNGDIIFQWGYVHRSREDGPICTHIKTERKILSACALCCVEQRQ